MTVTKADIERIAQLASLVADESHMARLLTDIEDIVDYVGQLSALDDPPTAQELGRSADAPLRPDVVAPIPLEVPISEIAPDHRDGFFVVPRLGGV